MTDRPPAPGLGWRFWCPHCEAYVPLAEVERNTTTDAFEHVRTHPDGVYTCPTVTQIRRLT